MKNLISITLLFSLLSNQFVVAQDTLSTEWSIIETSVLPNGNSEAWSIGTDQFGNVLWGVNMDRPGLFEFMDMMLYKMDENTVPIWTDTVYTGVYAQQSYNLKVTDSIVYLGGRTCSAIGVDSCDALFATSNTLTGISGWDMTWDGGFGYEEIDGIALESDGIYLTGWTEGNGSEIDVLLMKIDYAGNVIWQNSWGAGTARDDHQDGHMVIDDSLIYISGLFDGSAGLGWDGQALLAKFDRLTGNFVDSVTYGRNDPWFNAENALGMTSDGTYLYVTGYTTTSANNWDIFVTKFDKNLNQIWYTTWGGVSDAESARAIAIANDGSLYIGGNTASYGNGGIDVVLLKFDTLGNFQWYKTWGESEDDQTLDINIKDNNLYLTGKTKSFHATQKWEALLLKVDLDSIVGIDQNVSENSIQVYPNPTNSIITIDTEMNIRSVRILDLTGKIITSNSQSSKTINVTDLPSGIFFLEIETEEGSFTKKFIKQNN